MAPDRRFGLPHPLEEDSDERSSREKKGIWDSLKKAFGSEASGPTEAPPEPAQIPLPRATRPEPPPPAMPPPAAEPRLSAAAEVPFLQDLPVDVVAPAKPPADSHTETPAETVPPAAPSGAPRLARGLASFSKSNAEREARFSHILRDGPARKKKPGGK